MNTPHSRIIYLDNAATSWPKPPGVAEAMGQFLTDCGANPGRGAYASSIDAARLISDARFAIAKLFGQPNPLHVVFTKNATEALNLAICSAVGPHDHVVTSTLEHNSILRVLDHLQSRGVAITHVAPGPDGNLIAQHVERACQKNTRLIAVCHTSNVLGCINPIEELGEIARKRDILLCVDIAQSAGVISIDVHAMGIDFAAFSGHKGLYGPTGTGGLVLSERAAACVRPLLFGGTGSASDETVQPRFLPDSCEAGTLNTVGIAGLLQGLNFVTSRGFDRIVTHEIALTHELHKALVAMPGVRVLGPGLGYQRSPVLSFNIQGISCADVATELEERANICCRAGLHCAPLAHKHCGTFPSGAVRLSLGAMTTDEDIATTIDQIHEIARALHGK